MASQVEEIWARATVRVLAAPRLTFTGFLVARPHQLEDSYRCFLVTTKRAVAPFQTARKPHGALTIEYTVPGSNGELIGSKAEISLVDPHGAQRWKGHPHPEVDVLVVEITDVAGAASASESGTVFPQTMVAITYEAFADSAKLAELDVHSGEDVLIVGFLPGIRYERHHRPMVRAGMIASEITDVLEIDLDGADESCILSVPGFLVDGGVRDGSGCPVVLRPPGLSQNTGGSAMPPLLIGMLGELGPIHNKRAAPDHGLPGGLGLAFDAQAIRDTVELFFS